MSKTIRVIVFDFDGVLVNSVSVKDEAFYQLFLPHGKENASRAFTYHKNHPGMFRGEKIRRIFEETLGLSPSAEEISAQKSLFSRMVVEKIIAAPSVPGALTFLQKNSNQPLYVVSAAPQNEVREIVIKRGINKHFKSVFGGPAKKRDLLLHVFEIEQCDAKELLFVGDSLSDLKAAEEAEVRFLGIAPPGKDNIFPTHIPVMTDLKGLYQIVNVRWF
ncbi:MAG: HAD family hydrolase [Desulfobulbaceae bacterium]|nr:HAD family hydrolase [Desulfobulbaceae bacterium]